VVSGWHFILSFAVLIYALFALRWQAERAALAAAGTVVATAIVFGYNGVRPPLWTIVQALWRTGFAVLDIIVISIGAGIVIGVLNVTGLSFNLTYALVQLGAGEPVILLVLAALVCIVLGMGLPTLGVYVILAALVAPALVEVGVDRMAAHLFVLYFGMMSMITPPVAIAAFAAAGIANSDPMRTGVAAMRFGWSAYVVPFLFVASPSLLLAGEPHAIALAIVTAVMGVWLISISLAGYFVRPITLAWRAGFAAAGLLALIPAGAFPGALYTDIAGAVIGGLMILREVIAVRAHAPTRQTEAGTPGQ
jgi:TRAP-type uncharacterized transport system fused permease subunit